MRNRRTKISAEIIVLSAALLSIMITVLLARTRAKTSVARNWPTLVALPKTSGRQITAKEKTETMAKETFEPSLVAREQQARVAAFGLNTIRPMLKFQVSLFRLWANNIETFMRNWERGVETRDSKEQSHGQRAA
jgi:hypothetical protein